MMATQEELDSKFESGKINFEQYMETSVEVKPLEIKPSKLRGRRLAQRQGQMIKKIEPQGAPGGIVRLLAPNGPGYFEFNLNSNPATLTGFGFKENTPVQPIERSTAEKTIQDMQKLGWARVNDPKPAQAQELKPLFKLGWCVAHSEQGCKICRAAQKERDTAQPTATEDPEAPEDFVPAPGNLKTVEVAKRFLLAGNAYFTVRSLTSGTRYTFRVARANCKRCQKPGFGHAVGCPYTNTPAAYFVSYLAGPENSTDYVYLGWIKNGKFATTKASARLADSQVFKAFRWVWEHLANNQMPPKTEVWHEGRCGACGRKLTVPESIESGIGPVCAEKGGF